MCYFVLFVSFFFTSLKAKTTELLTRRTSGGTLNNTKTAYEPGIPIHRIRTEI